MKAENISLKSFNQNVLWYVCTSLAFITFWGFESLKKFDIAFFQDQAGVH